MFNIIKDRYLLSKATQAVKIVNHFISNTFSSNIGVFQGDVQSPILVNLYINGLLNVLICTVTILSLMIDYKLSFLLYTNYILLISATQNVLDCKILLTNRTVIVKTGI